MTLRSMLRLSAVAVPARPASARVAGAIHALPPGDGAPIRRSKITFLLGSAFGS
jgi:hypothetical protein